MKRKKDFKKIKDSLKQEILKYMFELCSKKSGIIFWEDTKKIYYEIPWERWNKLMGIIITKTPGNPIMYDDQNNAVAWEGGSCIDNDPFKSSRFIITEYDLNNLLDEMESEGLIKQDSSEEYHYHRVIMKLEGKIFYQKGGYNNPFYKIKDFIGKWINEITLMVAVLALIFALF